MQKQLCCGMLMLALTPTLAMAESSVQSHALWNPQTSLLLAATSTSSTAMPAEEKPKYKHRYVTANALHKYLGLGSLISGVLTVMAPKSEDTTGPHYQLAHAATYLGAGAVLTGIGFHFEDLNLGAGMADPDNQHALLGTLGTLGYAAAIDAAPGESHPSYGVAGLASMAIAVKLTW